MARDARRPAAGRLAQLLAVSGGDATLIGYLECEDFPAAQAAMEATEVNARWQAEMAEFFSGLDGGPPDEGMHPELEIFHLS